MFFVFPHQQVIECVYVYIHIYIYLIYISVIFFMFFSTPSSSLESLSRLTPLVLGQESLEIAGIFESAKLPLFVAYYRRCYARFLRLKKLLESQKYGKITAVHYRMERLKASKGAGWRENASISGGGFFVDVGSHALDLLDFLLGPLQQLSGWPSGKEEVILLHRRRLWRYPLHVRSQKRSAPWYVFWRGKTDAAKGLKFWA